MELKKLAPVGDQKICSPLRARKNFFPPGGGPKIFLIPPGGGAKNFFAPLSGGATFFFPPPLHWGGGQKKFCPPQWGGGKFFFCPPPLRKTFRRHWPNHCLHVILKLLYTICNLAAVEKRHHNSFYPE